MKRGLMMEKMNDNNTEQVVLFGFELNRSQTVLFLILSVTGIFILPLFLAIEIFSNLFQVIFFHVPNYLVIIEHFPVYYNELWFFYYFAPYITRILVNSLLLYLSIHVLNKILKPKKLTKVVKKRLIQKDRIVKWLGFKLNYGQSLLIFSLSLVGVLYSIQLFFDSSYNPDVFRLEADYCRIGDVSNSSLSSIISIVISVVFISLCFYSILVVKKRKTLTSSKKKASIHGLILFIIFLIIFLFFLMRTVCHVVLFTDLAYIFGASPAAINTYQMVDLIRTLGILIISVILIIASLFMREKINEQSKVKTEFTWLSIKITANRAIVLLSLTILFILFLSYSSLTIIFTIGLYYYLLFPSFVIIPILLLCYYSINMILKKKRITNILDSIESSEVLKTTWFKLPLRKVDSIVLLSISSGVIGIYLFYIMGINNFLGETLSSISVRELFLYELLGFLFVTAILVLLLAVALYTIKKTLPSIKIRK
jgi:hypothetical protein